jgi:VWFA-related protein
MRAFRLSTLIVMVCASLVCASPILSIAQEAAVVRVGVTLPLGVDKTVSATETRDRLVKALNHQKPEPQKDDHQKPDKKTRFSVEAVALASEWGGRAIAEAKVKECQFVLSAKLTRVDTSSIQRPNLSNLDTIPMFNVTVEYRLARVGDGATFAIGSVKGQDTTSVPAVVWEAISQVAVKAIADIAKAGPLSPGESRTESRTAQSQAEESAPARDGAAMLVPNFCAWLPSGIPHADVLPGVCEYVMNVAEKMPNFICHQEASRYRGKSRAPHDLITASVRYEDGTESYDEIKVNGRPATIEAAQSTGLWSTGEFGSGNLRSIFNLRNEAVFEFARETASGTHAAWVFIYHIAKQNEPLWRLHAADQVVAPPYAGELWIDRKTGRVLHFESTAKDFPTSFPLTRASLQIDYENIAFADGSVFVLPTSFGASTAFADGESTRNVVRLTDCHKFRAKGRLVLEAESSTSSKTLSSTLSGPAGSAPAAQVPPSAAALQKDLEESEAMFAAIRDQELQEDQARQERDRNQSLDSATASAVARIVALRKQQREIRVQEQAIARSTSANMGSNMGANMSAADESESRIAFQASGRMVLVSVVLRDAQGRAIGNLNQDAFQLFDNGKPQVITHFSLEAAKVGTERETKTAEANQGPEARQPVTAGQTTEAERNTAYLFDDAHSSSEELASASSAAVRHLKALAAEEHAAVFTTSGAVMVDFTDDRPKLLAAVRALRPHGLVIPNDCPSISYYMADLIVNKQDAAATGVAIADALICAFHGMGTLQQAAALVSARAHEVLNAGGIENKNSMAVLRNVVRRIGMLPGQRSIVLVSPGFVAITQEEEEEVTGIINRVVESGIVINALDARGLYALGFSGNGGSTDTDKLQIDTADAQARSDVMAELASSTGGVFFHNNNNLDEGFRRTGGVPEFLYVLGFSPQKLDGKFHKLKVTLNAAGKFDVEARRGYFAAKPADVKSLSTAR